MLACELALAGVRPVVLDVLPGPSDEPKANGLVGQVIRQLDMRDLYHTFGGDDDDTYFIDGDLGTYYEYSTCVMVNPPGSGRGGVAFGLRSAHVRRPGLHLGSRADDLGLPKGHVLLRHP